MRKKDCTGREGAESRMALRKHLQSASNAAYSIKCISRRTLWKCLQSASNESTESIQEEHQARKRRKQRSLPWVQVVANVKINVKKQEKHQKLLKVPFYSKVMTQLFLHQKKYHLFQKNLHHFYQRQVLEIY